MGDLQAQGWMKAIGVTNFNCSTLQQMVDTGVPLASNQVRSGLGLIRKPPGFLTFIFTFISDFISFHFISSLCFASSAFFASLRLTWCALASLACSALELQLDSSGVMRRDAA